MPTLKQTTAKGSSLNPYSKSYGRYGQSLSMGTEDKGSMSQSQASVKSYGQRAPGEERPSLTFDPEIISVYGDTGSSQVKDSSFYDRARAYAEEAYQGVRGWMSKTLGWSPIVEQDASYDEYTIPTQYYGAGSGEYDEEGNPLSAADVIRDIMGGRPEE